MRWLHLSGGRCQGSAPPASTSCSVSLRRPTKYSILATLRPKRIIEVGCGFSSAIALDVRDQELHDLKLTFIDPYPERLLELLKKGDNMTATIHRAILQDIPIETFDVLEKDDILFIDSTQQAIGCSRWCRAARDSAGQAKYTLTPEAIENWAWADDSLPRSQVNHRRIYQYCGDVPPVDLEAAYYPQQQRSAAG